MFVKVLHPYVTVNKKMGYETAIITGTRTRIVTIAAYYKLGLSPEELAREFPHLSLSQIHDALSYYYEHQEKIDKEIESESEDNMKKAFVK